MLEEGISYWCVAKGRRIISSSNGGDREMEPTARACLEKAPRFHAWYSETTKTTTYGMLADDGLAFFAMSDCSVGGRGLLRFLRRQRDRLRRRRSELQEELEPVIRRLRSSLEKVEEERAVEIGEDEEKGSSLVRLRAAPPRQRRWLRAVKIVLAVELGVCAAALLRWLALCRAPTN
ncbi:SNARE-like superfamily protein [Wolffia australiana]